jgi:hypothetical protein
VSGMLIPESRTKGDAHAQGQKFKATNEDVAFKFVLVMMTNE